MKKLSFFLMAMLISVMSFAETELFTQTYPGSPSSYTNAYTKSFTVTTGDYTLTYTNINNGQASDAWTAIRSGSKKGASVATIASEQIAAPIAKVVINFTQANASSTNALYLEVSANSDFSSATKIAADIAVGNVEFPIAAPAANQYYKITIDQAKGSANGFNRFDKVVFYQGEAAGEDVEIVAAPEFSVTEANFTTAFTLDITSEEGTTLKYTIDNTDPSTSATAIEVATNSTSVQITKSTAVKAIAIKGELKSVTKSKVYCYVNSAETAYTVAEAMEVIDAGLGLANELYVKGEISTIEKYDAKYGSITYWIKDEEGNKFECYSGLGLNKAKFTSIEDVEVGASVVACGVMKLFVKSSGDKIYEFNYNNYLVEYVAPVVNHTITVSANPAEAGTVTGAGTYEEGKTATLTATPAEGYEFVCWTEGADTVSTEAEYGFVVLADRNLVANFVEAAPEINYEEFIMSNLVVTTPAEGLEMLEASDPVNGISVMLGVYEDGTLHEDCLITFQGTELSIVSSEKVTKEYNEDVETDVYTVRVVVAFGGANMGLQLLMYATAAAEPIIINVEGATVTLTEYQISAEETAYELNMISNWVYEEDGLTYEVECLLPTFDPTKESGDYEASFFVRGEGNAFGMTEDAIVSVAKNGNQITLTGEITAYNNNVYNVTISGTLPVVEPTTITWELNGGEFPAVVVPTNEELAMAFKQEYAEYFAIEGLTDTDMNREVGNFIYVTNSKGGDAVKFITENANWKWLHDYILTVAGNIPEGTNVGYYWRANIDGFFHCKNAVTVGGVASADYTEAGKQEVWGAAYEAEYGVVLPTEPVAEDYTLPTPVKEGYTFVGWYDNAAGEGEAMTVLPAGWAGTLYAIWKANGPTTALDNIAVEGKAVKAIINGQLIIIKNGVQYNAQGQVVK